jgi:hypothetical protein
MFAGLMSRCTTPRRCIPRHRASQRRDQLDQRGRVEGYGPLGQHGAADVDQQNHPGRRRHAGRQLHDPFDTGQRLEHLDLVPQPRSLDGPQRLLADHGAGRRYQPGAHADINAGQTARLALIRLGVLRGLRSLGDKIRKTPKTAGHP